MVQCSSVMVCRLDDERRVCRRNIDGLMLVYSTVHPKSSATLVYFLRFQ